MCFSEYSYHGLGNSRLQREWYLTIHHMTMLTLSCSFVCVSKIVTFFMPLKKWETLCDHPGLYGGGGWAAGSSRVGWMISAQWLERDLTYNGEILYVDRPYREEGLYWFWAWSDCWRGLCVLKEKYGFCAITWKRFDQDEDELLYVNFTYLIEKKNSVDCYYDLMVHGQSSSI